VSPGFIQPRVRRVNCTLVAGLGKNLAFHITSCLMLAGNATCYSAIGSDTFSYRPPTLQRCSLRLTSGQR
jgi:hypothetical protein